MIPVSVCMIVKNEEKRLAKCLDSLAPFGFEIVIVDTGSEDNTVGLASNYTDKIYSFEWVNDFSAARNYSLKMAANPFIFMMDADEWIVSLDMEELNYFRKNLSDQVGAVTRQNFMGGHIGTTDHTERFFSRRHFHYIGRIHEMLAPLQGKELPVLLTNTVIGHSGYDMTKGEREA
ncbi:MAG: glycosyltransferase family 2 protein [Lachnospiraceae bacterium]|nr:glycosyltransferase family 2 protein [Lachnospiraceae bacterium]